MKRERTRTLGLRAWIPPGHAAAPGFTLLEVMVAMAILSLAVVAAIQLSSQALRLLKVTGDHQQAVLLADQLVRLIEPNEEGVETGQEGSFVWERRVILVPVPEDLDPPQAAPRTLQPRLFSVSVAVRWENRSVELATLRTSLGERPPSTSP